MRHQVLWWMHIGHPKATCPSESACISNAVCVDQREGLKAQDCLVKLLSSDRLLLEPCLALGESVSLKGVMHAESLLKGLCHSPLSNRKC